MHFIAVSKPWLFPLPLVIPREQRRWLEVSSGHGKGLLTDVSATRDGWHGAAVPNCIKIHSFHHFFLPWSTYKCKLWVENSPWVGAYCKGVPRHQCVCICAAALRCGKFPLTKFSCSLKMNTLTLEQWLLVPLWQKHAKQRVLQFVATHHKLH